jgi:hypothetical protein
VDGSNSKPITVLGKALGVFILEEHICTVKFRPQFCGGRLGQEARRQASCPARRGFYIMEEAPSARGSLLTNSGEARPDGRDPSGGVTRWTRRSVAARALPTRKRLRRPQARRAAGLLASARLETRWLGSAETRAGGAPKRRPSGAASTLNHSVAASANGAATACSMARGCLLARTVDLGLDANGLDSGDIASTTGSQRNYR